MESYLANELNGEFGPIVFIRSNEKSNDAIEPKKDRHTCVMSFIAQVIVNRKTAVFSKDTTTCPGAVSGFGFGNGYDVPEVGLENHAAFLSTGCNGTPNKEEYKQFISKKPKAVREMFIKGERIFSTYDLAYEFVNDENLSDISEEEFLIFKPLEDYDFNLDNTPEGIIFTVNPIGLSALITIDGSIRENTAFTSTPQASACQAISYHVSLQGKEDDPKAVLGLVDFAGRKNMGHLISNEYMNYSLPWDLFLKLEETSHNSLFQSTMWSHFK